MFAWAFARANNGEFVLRIEDTDQTRLVEGAVGRIYDALRWLGLEWDEGPDIGGSYGPYVQSERLEKYERMVTTLFERGRAYYCFCSPERLKELRDFQTKNHLPPGYDGKCKSLEISEAADKAKTESHVVRFKMINDGVTTLNDLVRGAVIFENRLQDDFVILKSDGFPTYHLALLTDDSEMQISHVIRGDEWLPSAPKHVQLFEAVGLSVPHFAHLPVLVGSDQKKLSKRTGGASALEYKEKGYLPDAMINFLAFLGWSLDDKTSIISQDELSAQFSLDRVVPNPALFDLERLDFLNGHHIRAMSPERWESIVASECPEAISTKLISSVAPLLQSRTNRLEEIVPNIRFLSETDVPSYDPKLLSEKLGNDESLALNVLESVIGIFSTIGWNSEEIESSIRGLQDEEQLGIKMRKFIVTLYVAIMGKPQGIPLFDSLVLLGREESLRRLQSAADQLKK